MQRRLPDDLRRRTTARSRRRPPGCISRRRCSTALERRGIRRVTVTLHVGAGTFLPVRADDITQHRMHAERGEITPPPPPRSTPRSRRRARGRGRHHQPAPAGNRGCRRRHASRPFAGETALFILPGYRFRAVDLLLTNFHLPRSTLFMLVCAFAGTGADARGLRARDRGGLSVLFLWRCMPAGARMTAERVRLSGSTPPTAPRAPACCTPRMATVATPAFMPVGTAGTVKAMTADAVRATGAGIVLGNTYHLMLRPGAERIARLGGLHRFMDWPGPILTDSGGFQVMSLAKLRKLDADGVTFQSHLDGSSHRLTPARSIEIQHLLDATITMVLDECTPFPATPDAGASVDGTVDALGAAVARSFRPRARLRAVRHRAGQRLSGAARGRPPRALTAIGFDGYAIGGLAVGEGQATMFAVLDATVPQLPADRPRYLMGVGTPDDIIGAVQRGIDMFDCVIPTRAGRTARAYTSTGVFNLRNARFADDGGPLDPACACPACTRHRRAYLHHLFKAEEMLGPMLLTWHNVQYYQDLMRGLRQRHHRTAGWPRMPARCAPAGARGGHRMTDENYAGLTQLGHHVEQPGQPGCRRCWSAWRTRRSGKHYVVRFTCPEFTSLCPITGQPDFAHIVIDYIPRDWIVESKSLKLYPQVVPQPRRVPRGLHHGDRGTADCRAGSGLAAHRRLLVSARRHADRRVLAKRRAAGGRVDSGAGMCRETAGGGETASKNRWTAASVWAGVFRLHRRSTSAGECRAQSQRDQPRLAPSGRGPDYRADTDDGIDPAVFGSGRHLAAWAGLTPKEQFDRRKTTHGRHQPGRQ